MLRSHVVPLLLLASGWAGAQTFEVALVDEPEPTVPVGSPATVADDPADTVADGPTTTVAAELPASTPPPTIAAGPMAILAQEALTHSEESVYDVLWGPKNQSKDSRRSCSIGYEGIARAARATKMNARHMIERLIYKGFVRVEILADNLPRIPTKYLGFSYRAALDNTTRGNRLYVVRTGNGVLFAHPLNPTATVAAGRPTTAASILTTPARSRKEGVNWSAAHFTK